MELKTLKVNLLQGKTGAINPPAPKSYRNLESFEAILRTKFELVSDNCEYKLWRVKTVSYIFIRVYKDGLIRVHLFGNFDTYRVLGADKMVDSISTEGDLVTNILKDTNK